MNQLSFFDVTEEEKNEIKKNTEDREIRCGRLFINGTFVPRFQIGDKAKRIYIIDLKEVIGIVTKTYGPFCYFDDSCLSWDQDDLELVE